MIHKKKKDEFINICTNDEKVKLLIIQGPSGCGKNSLIDCLAKEKNIQLERYKYEKNANLIDIYG